MSLAFTAGVMAGCVGFPSSSTCSEFPGVIDFTADKLPLCIQSLMRWHDERVELLFAPCFSLADV